MEEELNELLGNNSSELRPLESLDYIFKEQTKDIRNLEIFEPQRTKFPKPFDHLSRPQLYDAHKSINGTNLFSFSERPQYADYVKSAVDRTVHEGKVVITIDGVRKVVDFDPSLWQDSPLSGWGYGDILYVRPIQGTENELRKKHEQAASEELKSTPFTPFSSGGGDARVSGYLLSYLLERFDDGQVYEFLVPSVSPEDGKPIMEVVRGTYEEVIQRGYNPLNKFGIKSERDGVITSLLKGFANKLGETDDMILGTAKFAQDLIYKPLAGRDETLLDEIWDDTIKHTERTQFLLSEKADEFGSLEWLASGTGSAFGSLIQYAGVGSALRGLSLATFGRVAGSNAARAVVFDKITSLGASGIIGFGYAYNEALQNGLTEGDALLYGGLVGAVTAAIEHYTGQDFDRWLTGGGVKAISRGILKDMGGEVTEQGARRWLKEKSGELIKRVPGRISNMASEASEEVLQDIVEQGAQLTYNALLADKDAAKGDGKFDIDEFNFKRTVSAGIFGAIAASPFKVNAKNPAGKMAQYIMEGQADKVTDAINNLKAEGKITEQQYNVLMRQKRELEEAFNVNRALFDGISGEHAQAIKNEAFNLVLTRRALEQELDKITEGTKDKDQEEREDVKNKRQQIHAEIDKVTAVIEKYQDPEFIRQRVQKIKDDLAKMEEARNNIFARISSEAVYNPDQSREDTLARIGSLKAENFTNSVLIRTPTEASYAIGLLAENKVDQSIGQIVARDMVAQGFHRSPLVNTMANREMLLGMGININELPLTAEERADVVNNPEAYASRFMSPEQLDMTLASITDEMLAGDNDTRRDDGQYSKYDRMLYLIKNRESLGVTTAQLHSLDASEQVMSQLADEQREAIKKIHDTATPTTILHIGGTGSPRGAYHRGTGILFIEGALDSIEELRKSNVSEDRIKSLKNELFHVLAHESAHALFDRELEITHRAWVKAQKAGMQKGQGLSSREVVNAEFFDRVFKLAILSYDVLRDKPGAKRLYFFNRIMPAFLGKDMEGRVNGALTVVKEYFAEAFANSAMQDLLDSYDLNDPKNRERVKELNYNYNAVTGKKESLLAQAVKAVASVFSRLRNILSKPERTLLAEAFALGTNLQFNKFIPGKVAQQISELSFSHYDAVNLYEGEKIDPSEVLATLLKRLDRAQARLNDEDRIQLMKKMKEFVGKSFTKNNPYGEYLKGSMIVLYFKSTDGFMISWKSVNREGQTETNRAFFNKRGSQIYVNSDVNNKDSVVTLAKPYMFDAFDPNNKGEEWDNARAILNNLERARRENFVGEAFLELDRDKVWDFNGKRIRGQVQVVYRFSDGEQAVVGYAPDLTKIRLAHLLENGANIRVSLSQVGPGSRAWVRRDENGQITDVLHSNTTQSREGYTLENVSPRIVFNYTEDTSVPPVAEAVATSVDTVTMDNKAVEPRVDNAFLQGGAGLLADPNPDDIIPSFSLYDDSSFSVPPQIEYVREGLYRYLRKAMFYSPGVSYDTDKFYSLSSIYIQKAAAYLRNELPQNPNEVNDKLGFDNDEAFVNFCHEVIADISHEFRTTAGRNRDREDWDGVGGNPDGKISSGIKADLEAINYSYDGEKHWVNYDDVKDILFEAGANSSDFDSMVNYLRDMVNQERRAGRDRAILEAVYAYLAKDRSKPQDEREAREYAFFDSIKNSYWSQFHSYVHLDAITFAAQGEGAFMYINGENSYLQSVRDEFIGNAIRRVNEARDIVGNDGKAVFEQVKKDMTDFAIQRYTKVYMDQGMSQEEAEAKARGLIKKKTDVISEIRSLMWNYKEKGARKYFGVRGPGYVMFYKNREDYDRMVALVDSYFAYFGYDIPQYLFRLNRGKDVDALGERKKALMANGMSEQDANKEIARLSANARINDYHLVSFKASISNFGRDKEYGEFPFVMLANQTADFFTNEIKKMAENDPNVNPDTSELKELVRNVERARTGYRSPEFYFNAEFNKEWSRKIRSYTDDLIEKLSRPGSDLMEEYMRSELYKDNRLLESIRAHKGEKIQFMVAGIRGSEPGSGKSYESVGDLDYIYMNIAGYVQNPSSPFYYHLDDVPSDKPRISAFKMPRLRTKDLRAEIAKIQQIERKRIELANDRFTGDGVTTGAFQFAETRGKDKDGKKIIYYKIRNKDEFDRLVPGVHYKEVSGVTENGEKLYVKGSIFSDDNKFYGGGSVDDIVRKITEEYERAYNQLKREGMNFPVSTQFIKELNEKNLSPSDRTAELERERRRVFTEWYVNYVINRFHLNMVLMGDHAYYKSNDGFVDLSKRHAGTVAPHSRGVHGKPTISTVIIDDADVEEEGGRLTLPQLRMTNDGTHQVIEDANDLTANVNRTDAQGYVTKQFAEALQKSYGAFSGYEKIFKPVMFGVSRDLIKYAQPLYLKLSLVVIPDPNNEANARFYRNYPDMLPVAQKIYASGADMAVFTSGVKVGVNTVNKLSDETFKAVEFDSNLLGLQNNPYHDPNSDENFLNGMVQQTKQLGDNGNFEAYMSLYHEIEGKLVAGRVQNFHENKFADTNVVREAIKERLARNNFSNPISEFIDAGVRPLDNPAVAPMAEPIINSEYRDAVSLFPKDGEKLINVSDLGYGRPVLNEDEEGIRERILRELSLPVTPYNRKLQWVGPRRPMDLTVEQLIELQRGIERGLMSIDSENGFIRQAGEIKIYPAEALVPEGPNYKIGDRIIATRIPTAKKSNSTPAIVVGFTHEDQGNVIVLGKHGTAIHGYDFDIDGMFVWRERQREANQPVRELFNIAFDVLTDPVNYNEVTSPVVTDNIKRLAGEIDKAFKPMAGYSKFSPMRQVELKKLNSVGKRMIGAFASRSGIHSVLVQNNGSPFISDSANIRGYLVGQNEFGDDIVNSEFKEYYIDRTGKKVLVSDVYSELINAATDNAKLQLLGRLNINAITAPILSDMISHGVDLDYAIYFINQPAIRELVRRMEVQSASSTDNDDSRVINELMLEYEEKIRKEIPLYEFNRKNTDGTTHPESKSIIHYKRNENNQKFYAEIRDRVYLDFESLRSGLTDGDLEKQLIILDKFRYYKSLARITSDAGALVTLTSDYPKSFIELVGTRRRIADVAGINNANPKIDILGLMKEHGMYRVHWEGLNNLIDQYANHKIYAGAMLPIHNFITSGKSLDLQKKVHDDFYTYMLATMPGEYDLSTKSLTGVEIDPYHFVNESAKFIAHLKKEFPENEFLRILDVNIVNGTEEQFRDKAIEPSRVNARLLYEPSGELLKKIHQDFMSLPDGLRWTSDEIINEELHELDEFVAKPKDVILGHLLYTQGFGLGGFNFTKILPAEVIKSFDKVMAAVHEKIKAMGEQHSVEDLIEGGDESILDVISDLDLGFFIKFIKQVKLNHPELINEIHQDQIELAKRVGDHFDLWYNGQNEDPNADYDGAIKRVKRADGGEMITFMYKKDNPENSLLIRRMIAQGLVRMNNKEGKKRVFSVSDLQVAEVGRSKAAYVVLNEVNVRPMRHVKQYGPVILPSKSIDYVENRNYKAVEQEVAQSLPPVGEAPRVEPVYPTLPVHVNADQVRNGIRTAITVDGPVDLDAGQTIMLPSGDGSVIAKVESVYSLGAMLDIMKNRGLENAEQRLINRWAELEGVDPKTLNVTGFMGYVGGFENSGKGTPSGDGKDKAMRRDATGFVGEIKNEFVDSSSLTSLRSFDNAIISPVNHKSASSGSHGGVIMLARNGSLAGQPLEEETKNMIRSRANIGATFIVGDMPNVDTQFIEYLQEIGANFRVYHTGNSPRITVEAQNPVTDLITKYQIKLKYIAHVGADGKIRHRARGENGEEFSRFDPIPEFSEYRPYEVAGLYKAVATVAASKLKGRQNVTYDPAAREAFTAALSKDGFDAVEIQVILDMINHWGNNPTDTHTIADQLETMAAVPGNIGLKHFNSLDSYERNIRTPLEKLYAVGEGLFGPQWSDRLVHEFDQWANVPVNEDVIINISTGEPYTHYEWLVLNFEKYLREERIMDEYKQRVEAKGLLNMDYDELRDMFVKIRQNMGRVNGLVWKDNMDFIKRLAHRIGVLAEARSFKIIGDKTGNYQSFEQEDFKTWEEEITSITDFTERQAAMQEIGRLRSAAAIRSDMEKTAVISEMERLMKNVAKAYYAHKPKSFVDRIQFWKKSEQARVPFDWMFEIDKTRSTEGNPVYTGRMVARYEADEAEIRKQAFEREKDANGNDLVFFKRSNRQILKDIKDNGYANLTAAERAKVDQIASRYNNYTDFHEMYETFTEEQRQQSAKDTSILREMWIRMKVRNEDGETFKILKQEARDFAGTARGDYARACIELYDFLYNKSNELLMAVGYYSVPADRGIMPQTAADIQELWSRYGFSEAWNRFVNDDQDDIDIMSSIDTASGVAIPAQKKDFSTSFVVPFRTLREKENFSVSAPKIFAHHFKSLIFKKHHDEVLPMMDAVRHYYHMKQELGEGRFDNLIKFIEEHANQRIFFKQRDFTKTKFGKAIRGLGSIVVTQFLGLAPGVSLTNWIVGNTETYKHMMGEYGLSMGTRKFIKGFGRILSSNARGFFLNKKAVAIMNYYGIETFTTSEVQRLGDVLGTTQDFMLALQKNSEIFVRGAAFFAEMSDDQWNAFEFKNGELIVRDPSKVPTIEEVAEWKNKIGSIQGKYDDETKRLYHGNAVFQAAMLFGGWMIDYIRSRVGKLHYDQFGVQREGYYRTGWRLAKDLGRVISFYKGDTTALTDIEQQNLRKLVFDLLLKVSFWLMQAVLDEEDPTQKWFYNYITKLNSQLFFLLDFPGLVQRVKSPFAGLFPIEQLAKIFDAAVEFDMNRAADAGYALLPGRQIINTVVDVADLISDEN